jgi:hypothetical protein
MPSNFGSMWRASRAMAVTVPHPPHEVMTEVAPGIWNVSAPIRPTGFAGWKARHACRKRGGHWWHPSPGTLVDWFCCQCGAERDGWPEDGT